MVIVSAYVLAAVVNIMRSAAVAKVANDARLALKGWMFVPGTSDSVVCISESLRSSIKVRANGVNVEVAYVFAAVV